MFEPFVFVALTAILALLVWIANQQEKQMTQADEVQALVLALNDATNREATLVQGVSDRIDRILAAIPAAGGLSVAQTEQLKAELMAINAATAPIVDRLTALGQDAAEPIPPVVEG